MKKGISPLIAAVLLIAFTMAVASLFAQWAPQLIKSAQGDTINKSSQVTRCSNVILQVQKTDMSGTVDSVTFQQVSGENGVGNVSVTWFYQGRDILVNYTEINSPRKAKQITSTNTTVGDEGNIEEISITPIECEGAPSATYKP